MLELLHGLILMTVLAGSADSLSEESCAANSSAVQRKAIHASSDARSFFELLVQRYRGLTSYSDLSRIVQIIRHAGEVEPHRIEMEVSSEIADGGLKIETALTQIRHAFGLNLPLPHSEPMEQAELQYQLWMLPHLTLKFTDEPLRDFREGVHEGFTATDVTPVTVDDRALVHLELRSGDGADDESSATFDLYVDPASMLIERIRGQQRLPDGGSYETTVDIVPRTHESDVASDSPAYSAWRILARLADADESVAHEDGEVTGAANFEEEPETPASQPYPTTPHPMDPEPILGPIAEPVVDEPRSPEEPQSEPDQEPAPAPEPRPATPPSSGSSSDQPEEAPESPGRGRSNF